MSKKYEKAVADLTDSVGRFKTSMNNLTATSEEVASMLFCAYLTSKQHGIVSELIDKVNEEADGSTFGHRYINWVVTKGGCHVPDKLKLAWFGMYNNMATLINRLIKELAPTVPAGETLTIEQIQKWVRDHGGIAAIHREHTESGLVWAIPDNHTMHPMVASGRAGSRRKPRKR